MYLSFRICVARHIRLIGWEGLNFVLFTPTAQVWQTKIFSQSAVLKTTHSSRLQLPADDRGGIARLGFILAEIEHRLIYNGNF
jgi:hypothetical protein